MTCDRQEISRVEPGAHRKAIRHKAAPQHSTSRHHMLNQIVGLSSAQSDALCQVIAVVSKVIGKLHHQPGRNKCAVMEP